MKKDNQNNSYQIAQPLLLSAILALGIFMGYQMNDKTDSPLLSQISDDEGIVHIGRVEEVLKFIETKYVDGKEQNDLVESAIYAVMDHLDPHSVYISPDQIEAFNESMEGYFNGLGIETIFTNDTVGIVKVMPGSPADIAGLKQFDLILAIDTSEIAGKKLSYAEIREHLHMGQGSILLKVLREHSPKPLSIEVSPQQIFAHTASAGAMVDAETGIIKIEQFTSNTYKEFMESYEELFENHTLKNLIIDLRNNPGGFLPEATKILNQLTKEKDKVILYTLGKNGVRREYKTNGKSFFDVANIAVLVNEESASGAEIIAGTIQDWDRGVIIGRRTYGKGLVQEQYPLNNGGALRLTTSRYYLPSGRNIQKDYTDLELYDYELEQRIANGDIFHESINPADSADLKFKSLHLGRKLKDANGVEPDIFIPADSLDYETTYGKLRSISLGYIFQKLRVNKTLTPDLINSKAFIDNFISYAQKVYPELKVKKITNSEKEKIKSALVNDYRYIISDEDTELSLTSIGDQFVISALDYFKKPDLARLSK